MAREKLPPEVEPEAVAKLLRAEQGGAQEGGLRVRRHHPDPEALRQQEAQLADAATEQQGRGRRANRDGTGAADHEDHRGT